MLFSKKAALTIDNFSILSLEGLCIGRLNVRILSTGVDKGLEIEGKETKMCLDSCILNPYTFLQSILELWTPD